MSGFRKFLLRGNLVDLAVAVVIGTAFAAVVTALVKDIITPLIAAVGGQPNFETLTFTIPGVWARPGAWPCRAQTSWGEEGLPSADQPGLRT